VPRRDVLEIHILNERWQVPLGEFFEALDASGDGRWFHPHPLTSEEARRRACYSGRDLYYVLVDHRQILGYGMLRGWDEGYEIPSLGIALHPDVRGRGLGRVLMHFLHAVARHQGARKVRLKVCSDNQPAVALYRSLGYTFELQEAGQWIGTVQL
jgi:[ribosomal protein S18]-alanine N-acetyltransferase